MLYLIRVCPQLFLGRQHRAATPFAAAITGKFFFELGGVALINRQAVVVVELFARLDISQRFNINAVIDRIAFAVGLARVVDPFSRVALYMAINDAEVVDMKKEGVIGLLGVVWVAIQRFVPTNQLAFVFDDAFAFFDWFYGKNAASVNARLAGLNFSRHNARGMNRD